MTARTDVRQVLLIVNPLRRADASGAPRQPERWREHLRDFGWNPVVLTAEQPPPVRTRHQAVRGLFVPDSYVVRWLPKALVEGRRLLGRTKVDAMLSSSPLDTCHLVALGLRRRAGVPWLADFRDPWIGNPFSPPRPGWARRVNRRLERRVVGGADIVTCVSEQHRSELRDRYPAARVEVLPNGYDPIDLEGIEPAPGPEEEVTLVHTGSFYGVRTPELLLSALHLLPDNVRLHLIGGSSPAVEEMVDRHDLDGRVVVTEPLPHREALARSLGADVLVVVPGADQALPAKLYEYAATGKPVLNVGPATSATGRAIEEWKIGSSAETPEAIAAAVQSIGPVDQPPDLQEYERRAITERLAGLLEDLCVS